MVCDAAPYARAARAGLYRWSRLPANHATHGTTAFGSGWRHRFPYAHRPSMQRSARACASCPPISSCLLSLSSHAPSHCCPGTSVPPSCIAPLWRPRLLTMARTAKTPSIIAIARAFMYHIYILCTRGILLHIDNFAVFWF